MDTNTAKVLEDLISAIAGVAMLYIVFRKD